MSTEVRSDFNSYLQRYCEDRNLTKEEALTHKIVQLVKESYDKAQEGIVE